MSYISKDDPIAEPSTTEVEAVGPYSKEECAAVKALWYENLTYPEIAARGGISSRNKVARIAALLGLPKRRPGNPSGCFELKHKSDVKDAFKAMWFDGEKLSTIALKLGISKNAAAGLRHRMKLPKRPSPIGVTGRKDVAKADIAASAERPAVEPRPKPAPRKPKPEKRSVPVARLVCAPVTPAHVPPASDDIRPPTPIPAEDGCRWIYGDVKTGHYSYCEKKAAKMWPSPFREPVTSWCREHYHIVYGGRTHKDAA